ncbi:hypothetical protein F442_05585 [Phytophthora nicotianae P10297]|uniref:Uncharacterized protein n=2 Tax=Phytophthora nicotianae TaxID=4792 RepID=W2ZP17_PHYNI|nr:hypothetical protein F442_05585 [Phytophthora nicotianae P10297]
MVYKKTSDTTTAGLREMLSSLYSANVFIYASFFIVTSDAVALAHLIVLQKVFQFYCLMAKKSASTDLQTKICLSFYRKLTSQSSLVDGVRLFVGSSNASIAGLGATEHPQPSNHEANVMVASMSDCPMGNASVRTLDVFKVKFAKEFEQAAWLDKILSLHKTVPHKSS